MSAQPLRRFVVITATGRRVWYADDEQHAREQHKDAFGDEPGEEIEGVQEQVR